MTDDPLDRLVGSDEPMRPRPGYSQALRQRLDLQRRTTAAAADTTRLIPYLAVGNAIRAIEFYASVFGASLNGDPFRTDDGRISHAELLIGDATIYLSDEFPEMNIIGPTPGGGHSVSIVIHVRDADLCMAAAEASGAAMQRPVQDQWNSRSGWFIDPFGHRWSPTSHTNSRTQGATA